MERKLDIRLWIGQYMERELDTGLWTDTIYGNRV
jgi:hypothetical protein